MSIHQHFNSTSSIFSHTLDFKLFYLKLLIIQYPPSSSIKSKPKVFLCYFRLSIQHKFNNFIKTFFCEKPQEKSAPVFTTIWLFNSFTDCFPFKNTQDKKTFLTFTMVLLAQHRRNHYQQRPFEWPGLAGVVRALKTKSQTCQKPDCTLKVPISCTDRVGSFTGCVVSA